MQAAANDLCAIYRTYCFDFEQVFVAAVQKQKEHMKHQPARPVGQNTTQLSAQGHLSQAVPHTHAEHNDLHQRSTPAAQESTSNQRSQSHLEHLSIDQHATTPQHTHQQQPQVMQPQSQGQAIHLQQALHQAQSQSVQQTGLPHQSPPSSQLVNQQRPPQTNASRPVGYGETPASHQQLSQLSVHSAETIMSMSDDQLREVNVPEESIAKIRQARAQRDQKQVLPLLPPLPSTTTSSARFTTGSTTETFSQSTSSTHDALPGRPALSAARLTEADNIINQLKTESVQHAKNCKLYIS